MSEKKLEQRCLRLTDRLSIALSVVTITTVLSSCLFWIYKTDELPTRVGKVESRVDKTEIRIDKLERQMVENSTKTDMILREVIEIRSFLLSNR